MRRFGWIVGSALLLTLGTRADAHRSGCHRWHSCQSDRGTYVCGDLGYCSQCPDNRYCVTGKPRAEAKRPKDREGPERPRSEAPKGENERGADER